MDACDQQSPGHKAGNKRKSHLPDRPEKHPRNGSDAVASQDSHTASAHGSADQAGSLGSESILQQLSELHHDKQPPPQQQQGLAAQQQQQQQARTAQQPSTNAGTDEAMGAGSSEASDEADNIASKDKYIRGTRLVIGGWFQACRGCNEPTAHTANLDNRDVPLCPRCQGKFDKMVSGQYPEQPGQVDPAVEPLCYWLPRMLAPMPHLAPDARRTFCSMLVLRQDDAWNQLCRT